MRTLETSQFLPKNPGGHSQVKLPSSSVRSTHVPPFWQVPSLSWQYRSSGTAPKQHHEMHEWHPKMGQVLRLRASPWPVPSPLSHSMPPQPGSQLHSQGRAQEPCTQPGYAKHLSQLVPHQPTLHLWVQKGRVN